MDEITRTLIPENGFGGEDARKNLIHLSTALLKMWRKLDAGD